MPHVVTGYGFYGRGGDAPETQPATLKGLQIPAMVKSPHIELSSRPSGNAIDLDVLKRKSWPGITAEFARIASPMAFDFRLAKLPGHCHYLVLNDIYRSDGETIIPGLTRNYVKDIRNKMTFVPGSSEMEGWSSIAKPGSYLALYFDDGAADGEPSALSQIPPLLQFEDHMLRSALMRFQAILHDPSLDQPGYAETLGTLLAFELGRYTAQWKKPAPQQGGLTTRQVRVVVDYMDSHLTEQMSISDLATLLNLSRFHFIRAFKHTVGTPPHQFILRRRVERAKELLADPRLSVTEIASRAGFNSTTQLTRAFRRFVGTTPTTFRRDS
jgi:AraC family transcriptional regulator